MEGKHIKILSLFIFNKILQLFRFYLLLKINLPQQWESFCVRIAPPFSTRSVVREKEHKSRWDKTSSAENWKSEMKRTFLVIISAPLHAFCLLWKIKYLFIQQIIEWDLKQTNKILKFIYIQWTVIIWWWELERKIK